MNSKLLQQLLNFGLSDKEAKIYISLLETGALTVFEIAKNSGINRSSAYVVLESLKKRGLVGISNDKKVRKYVASSPEILLETAKQESRKFESITQGLEQIIPDLKAIHAETKHKPTVKVFEGRNGLINLFEDSLYCQSKELRIVSELLPVGEILTDYVPEYVKKRLTAGIKMFGIHPDSGYMENYKELAARSNDEAVFIPSDRYKTPADLAIYDNKIAYMTAQDGGFGVLIEDQNMAEAMKSLFDLAYAEAKRLENSK